MIASQGFEKLSSILIQPRVPRLSRQKWIGFALVADGGQGTVSRDYDGFVRQCQNRAMQGLHDFLVGASGQVGAANGAGKERVAGDEFFLRCEIQADTAFGVT